MLRGVLVNKIWKQNSQRTINSGSLLERPKKEVADWQTYLQDHYKPFQK